MNEVQYSSAELMIINVARLLRDGDVVFVGVGQPNLACNLAKRTHAPNLVMIYEACRSGARALATFDRRPHPREWIAFCGEYVRYFLELPPARQCGCGVYGRRADR